MWICICHAVTDREVNAAIASGAATREAVTTACGAGGDCGSCHHMIEQMIEASGRDEVISPETLVRHRAA
jgi:bacterioferritin-associated ferredoxin